LEAGNLAAAAIWAPEVTGNNFSAALSGDEKFCWKQFLTWTL